MAGKGRVRPLDFKDGGMDAGLFVLAAVTPRGVARTQEEIAFVCDCTKQNIQNIERNALKKIRAEMIRRGVISE